MEQAELIAHVKRLRDKVRSDQSVRGIHTEVAEFIRIYLGAKSSFYYAVMKIDPDNNSDYVATSLRANLDGLFSFLEAGLSGSISPHRQGQLDVVSDFLGMSNDLLENPKVHPAAPAVLIGATLEEFLRSWIEAEELSIGDKKPGLEVYSQMLREADLITKQDGKDITSWAGVRNHAAHGEWDEVADKKRISLMLEGVNLFMRRYSPEGGIANG